MTEEEWLAGRALLPLLNHVRASKQYRRLRLLTCACARQAGAHMVHELAESAISASERYADGELHRYDLKQAQRKVWPLFSQPGWTPEGRELIRRAAWA